ncbi:MAG TPA: GNAT family N-acetyltransferase [Pyrinomonadaceae bacterium]|nr:GNAT family N-acetyltransferase [Pyrinomonadaceae bacterium]
MIVIREATAADIPVIFDIRLSVKENILTNTNAVTPEVCREYLETNGNGWIAEIDGVAAGFSIASSKNNSIWALFVRPEFESQGIGKALLNQAVAWLFTNGATEITLSTGAGTSADEFYQRQGWHRGETDDDGEVRFTRTLE